MTVPEVSDVQLLDRATRARQPLVRQDRVIVGALMLLALGLRAPNLGRAYWVDEGISIGIASHPLKQIPGLLRRDGSPPLFYVVLHFWIRLFGTSEIATHMLPLLVSLGAVPVAYWAGRELFGREAGVAAAALFATNPFLDWYGTETRMYPIVIVLSVLGVTFAWRAVRDRSSLDAASAVVAFAALVYTHDWGIYLTLVTAAVFFGLSWLQGDRKLAWWVLGAGGAVLVLWLPWLPSFAFQAKNTAAPWAVQPGIGDFFADPASAIGGTLGFLIAPLLIAGGYWCRHLWTSTQRQVVCLFAALGLLTTLTGFIGAQIEPSWTVRYLAVIVGPFLLAAAGAFGSSRQGQAIVVVTCTLLGVWAVVGVLLPNSNGRYAKSNVAAVADAVAPQLQPGDLVVVTQTEQLGVLYHYLPKGLVYVTPTGPVLDPSYVDWRNIVARLRAATPCAAIAPTLDSLPVGSAVLLINPARQLGASGSAWSRAVNTQVQDVDSFLAGDPALTSVGTYTPGVDPRPFSPVVGILFRKTAARSACA
jgi:mannosyltransferase